MTKKILAAALVALIATKASAQTANQTVTIQVNAINQIAFAGSPSLVVSTATAGSPPAAVSTGVATWAVTTNQSGAKITASIPTAMPTGLTLSANLANPTGATSAGFVALSATAVDLVTGITKLAQGSLDGSPEREEFVRLVQRARSMWAAQHPVAQGR